MDSHYAEDGREVIFESVPENKMVENDGKKKDTIQEVIRKRNCEMTVKRNDKGLWWGSQKSRIKF